MANIKWCETADDSSCVLPAEWNLMTEYIKHSAVTDFTIYGTENECVDTDQIFRFTSSGDYAQIFGMSAAGKDLMISANDGEFRSRITLLGGGNIHLDSGNDVIFKENGIEKFKFYDGKSIDFSADRAIHIDNDETYVGHGAGDNMGIGINNTLIGHDAGNSTTMGNSNTCIGFEANKNNIIGTSNAILGYQAGLAHLSYYNTYIGNECSVHNNGTLNSFFGHRAGWNMTTASYNVLFGCNAGRDGAAGCTRATCIGYEAGRNNVISNRLYINTSDSSFPLIYGEFDNDVVKFGNNNDAFFLKFSHDANDSIVETPTNNRSIFLKPHGTGFVKFGAYVATPAADSTGYIIIEDAAGNQRKVMIQA